MVRMGYDARVGSERGSDREGIYLEGPGSDRENNIKVGLKLIRFKGVE
jgi:hypothetical protein